MPSSHSSSSHSSSSHSSSSHSSSSHSSSSRSGSSRSSSGGSWRSSSRSGSPSRHSRSSHSPETYRSHYVRDGSMRGSVIQRVRSNQPQGYDPGEHYNVTPIPHYCVRHNYEYYPLSWTDRSTGREYKKGYYDENGQYYETVVFRRSDGVYKNVVCQCQYCDTVSKIDWTEGGALICPQCGGSMKICSALDEYTQDPMYRKLQASPGYVDYRDRRSGFASRAKLLGVIAMVLAILVIGVAAAAIHIMDTGVHRYVEDQISNTALFGTSIHLRDLGDGAYEIVSGGNYDRTLQWDAGEESYYDPDSQLWAWYNTDVTPPLWQYWYEPISGDYGDFGWMEYEDGLWYIEAEQGEWTRVPQDYDITPLWHIE